MKKMQALLVYVSCFGKFLYAVSKKQERRKDAVDMVIRKIRKTKEVTGWV